MAVSESKTCAGRGSGKDCTVRSDRRRVVLLEDSWGVECELDRWRWSGSSDRESGKAQAQMALGGKLS
jgi:hypothetical protein